MSEEVRLDFEPEKSRAEKRREAGKPPRTVRRRSLVPVLPPLEVDPDELREPTKRSVACVNMRLAGAPFHEIARSLDYADAASAKAEYISALARMNPVEDWETLRQTEALRAEQQLARSAAMASADFLLVHRTAVDDEGNEYEVVEEVPNTDKLRWHEQHAKDLALHAMITGAKAPARVELSADTQELNQMVQVLLQTKGGQAAVEADIWDAEEVPDEADPMGE